MLWVFVDADRDFQNARAPAARLIPPPRKQRGRSEAAGSPQGRVTLPPVLRTPTTARTSLRSEAGRPGSPQKRGAWTPCSFDLGAESTLAAAFGHQDFLCREYGGDLLPKAASEPFDSSRHEYLLINSFQ